jgi:hypothetical protein
MTPTTHIATACLLTTLVVKSGTEGLPALLVVTGGSLLLHLASDMIPHGYIATSHTIFRKIVPTVIEIFPGPLILLASIWLMGNPVLFIIAAFFGLLPDFATTLYCRDREKAAKIPLVLPLHRLHRKIHWFETELSDGEISFLFPNRPLLAFEAVCVFCILTVLFKGTLRI